MSAQALGVTYAGNPPHRRAVGDPLHMLIDGLYRKNVCYIIAETWNDEVGDYERLPVGTAFFIQEPIGPSGGLTFAVTARHVVEGIRYEIGHRDSFLRLNTPAKGYVDVPVSYDDWVLHPDTDIAVCRLRPGQPHDAFGLWPSELGAHNAMPGHDVFLIGLFRLFPGERSMDALVRFGKVSYPRTKVPISLHGWDQSRSVDAYLVEVRSWGGESGSPVFLHDEYYVKPGHGGSTFGVPPVQTSIQKSEVTSSLVRPKLLGILHGHFEAAQDVTSGIAVVIPADHILPVLRDTRFDQDREEVKKRFEELRSRQIPKPDVN